MSYYSSYLKYAAHILFGEQAGAQQALRLAPTTPTPTPFFEGNLLIQHAIITSQHRFPLFQPHTA